MKQTDQTLVNLTGGAPVGDSQSASASEGQAHPSVQAPSSPPTPRPQLAPPPPPPLPEPGTGEALDGAPVPWDLKSAAAFANSVRPLDGLGFALRAWLVLFIVAYAGALGVLGVSYWIVYAANTGGEVYDWQRDYFAFVTRWGDGMDGVTTLIYWICGFLYCRFVYRAVKNLHAMQAKGLETTPVGAVVWNFIPIAYFFVPFMVMSNIWRHTHRLAGAEKPTSSAFVFWWAFWVLSLLASIASAGIARATGQQTAFDLGTYQVTVGTAAAGSAASVLSAVALLGIVRGVSRAHDRARLLLLRRFETN